PFVYPDLPYDPMQQLTPVTLTTLVPYVIMVNPSTPAKSIAELIALAKAKPGQLNYGSGSLAGPPSTAAKMFNSMAGVNVVGIGYKSAGAALNDLIAGRVQMMVATASTLTYVKSGKLRALAVTSLQPSPLAPGLPPVSETLPGYDVVSTMAIFVP